MSFMNVPSSMRFSFSGQVASAQPSVRNGPISLKISPANFSGDDIGVGGLSGRKLTGDT